MLGNLGTLLEGGVQRDVGSLCLSAKLQGQEKQSPKRSKTGVRNMEKLGEKVLPRLCYKGRHLAGEVEVRKEPIPEVCQPEVTRLSVLSGAFIFFDLGEFLNPRSGIFHQGSATELHPNPNIVFF